PGMLNGTSIAIHFIEDKFARWPSHAFAAALFGLAGGRGSHPARALLWSAAWPALTLAILAGVGVPLYARLAGRAVEGLLLARPVSLGAPLRAKAALYTVAGCVGLGGITLLGGWRLGFPARGLAGFGGLLGLMSATIVVVALGLGVAWPDFRGRPADALATS